VMRGVSIGRKYGRDGQEGGTGGGFFCKLYLDTIGKGGSRATRKGEGISEPEVTQFVPSNSGGVATILSLSWMWFERRNLLRGHSSYGRKRLY